jgi:hypothetical protein
MAAREQPSYQQVTLAVIRALDLAAHVQSAQAPQSRDLQERGCGFRNDCAACPEPSDTADTHGNRFERRLTKTQGDGT